MTKFSLAEIIVSGKKGIDLHIEGNALEMISMIVSAMNDKPQIAMVVIAAVEMYNQKSPINE